MSNDRKTAREHRHTADCITGCGYPKYEGSFDSEYADDVTVAEPGDKGRAVSEDKPVCTCQKDGSAFCKFPHPCRRCSGHHSGVSCYWHLQGKTAADKRSGGRTYARGEGGVGCDECCTGDRCDDPSHTSRENCPFCLGSGTPDAPPVPKPSGDKAEAIDVEVAAKLICPMCRDGIKVGRFPGGYFHDENLSEYAGYGSWPFGCHAGKLRKEAEAAAQPESKAEAGDFFDAKADEARSLSDAIGIKRAGYPGPLKKAEAGELLPKSDNHFLYASEYAGVTFQQAAAVAVALSHKGWRVPSRTPEPIHQHMLEALTPNELLELRSKLAIQIGSIDALLVYGPKGRL